MKAEYSRPVGSASFASRLIVGASALFASERTQRAAPYLLVIAFWMVAAAQWPLRDLVVPWDSKNQFYAFFRFMAQTIHEGSLPFWNPYHYGGHPSIADPQSLIFSPAFVLWALVDPKPSLFAFDLMVFAHLLGGGLAIAAYGQRRAWPTSASVLAAMVFMLGGAVSGRMNHVGIIIAYGLFPIALLWMEIALDKRSWRAAIGFGAVAALIVLGRTQEPLLMCFVLTALLTHHILRRDQRLQFFFGRIPVLAAAALTGAAIAVVPLLLTVQFSDFSNRPEMDLELALRSSLYPVNFANLFSANVFGSLNALSVGNWGPGYFTRPEVDSTDRAFNYLFAGTLPALLLMWHGFAGRRLFGRDAIAFAAIALFAVLYAMGRYTPLFPFLFKHVPGVDLFRRPVGATFIFLLALAFLSGRLLADYIRDGLPKCSRLAACVCGLSVAGLLVWAIAFSQQSSKGLAASIELGKSALVYAGVAALLLLAKSARARMIAASVAVLITGAELTGLNAASVMNAESRAYYAVLESPTPEAQQVVAAIEADSKLHSAEGVRPRVEMIGLGGPWQNAAMVLGLEATNGYNPLRIGAYDRLVSPGESNYAPVERRFPRSFPTYDCLLGRMLGLQYVVLDRPIEKLPSLARRSVADAIMSGPRVWIYRLENVEPRVTLESRVQVADAEAYIDAGQFPASMPDQEVLVDADDDLLQKYPATAGPGKSRITRCGPGRVEIAVESATPNILTLHDPWYPGWEVEVDGVRKPLLRTDILFRGVEVPAGAHKVAFVYRPLSWENLLAAAQIVLGETE